MIFDLVNQLPPYGKATIVVVVTAALLRLMVALKHLSTSESDPHTTLIKQFSWFHVLWGAGLFLSIFYFIDFSFADACLIASAVFLYIGGINPLIFALLIKARLPAGPHPEQVTKEIDDTERETNLSAMFAVLLALVWGYLGAFFLANENARQPSREVQLAKLEKLDSASFKHQVALDRIKNDLDTEIHNSQDLKSKNEELVGRIDRLMEELMTVTEAVQKLKMGDARDMRVDDLASRQDAFATALKEDDKDVRDHQTKLELINKKLKLWKPVLQ